MKHLFFFVALTLLHINNSFAQDSSKDFRKLANCIEYNNKSRAERLLDKGININARDDKGRTPLLYALYTNNPNFAYFLLQQGADISLTDNNGNTSLHYAIENVPDRRTIDTLLAKGTKLEATNNQGYSPFHFSILFACPDLPFRLIKKGVYIHGITALGENALFLALESGCDTLTSYLLEHDIDTRLVDTKGNTALIKAIKFDQTRFALELAEREKNIDFKDREGHPAIYYAITNQNDTVFQKLLVEGATVKNDSAGAQYLEIASQAENDPMVVTLLKKGIENPMTCTSAESCFNAAYILSVEARISNDSVRINNLEKSIQLYTNSKEKFSTRLGDIRAENTANILGKCCLTISYALMGMVYVSADGDYHSEERAYLKKYMNLCDQRIAYLQSVKNCLTSGEKQSEDCFAEL